MSTTSTGSSSPRSAARRGIEGALRTLGVRPARALGQSFLVDAHVADAEAALVAEGPGPVLEIGPGLGALTEALQRRGVAPLVLLERDRRLVAHLKRAFPPPTEVREGDARTSDLDGFGTICGNLPFSVATPILLRAVRTGVSRVVVLVQEEVAQRIAAGPGSGAYGRLTLGLGLFAEVELFLPVPSTAFEPVPEVAGRVLVLTRRPGPPPVPDPEAFARLTARLFAGRRKQLKNLLPGALPDGLTPEAAAAASGWPDDWAMRRPESLAPEAYHRLARTIAAALAEGPERRPAPGRRERPRPVRSR